MIYSNEVRVRLGLDVDSGIPPLTPCDPTRRRYTPFYAECVAEAVLESAGEMRRNVKVTRAEAARLSSYAWALREHDLVRSGAYVVQV